MKLSNKRRTALYRAISDPILELRVRLSQRSGVPAGLDRELYDLEVEVWKQVTKALNIDEEMK